MLRSGFSSQSKGGELGRFDGFCDGPGYESREEGEEDPFENMAERLLELDPSLRSELLSELVELRR